MALINGIGTNDTLIGTGEADILNPFNGSHAIFGGAGADLYDLPKPSYSFGVAPTNTYVIDEAGADSAIDTIAISGIGSGLVTLRNYYKYSSFIRVGDDLVATVPGQAAWFHHPGTGSILLTIKNQFSTAHPEAAIEKIVAGGVSYNLALAGIGTAVNDIVVGTEVADSITSFAGDDYINANGGDDVVNAGSGNDMVFCGLGNDTVSTSTGDDIVFGEFGNDVLRGGAGNDQLDGSSGNDKLYGDAGNDRMLGGDGNNYFSGGAGADAMIAGAGSNTMIGGTGEDSYSIVDGAGRQTVTDIAAANEGGQDSFNISDSTATNYLQLGYARTGNNLVITTPAGAVITFKGQFDTDAVLGNHAIEYLSFNNGGWGGSLLISKTLTDDSEAPPAGVLAPGATLIIGSAADDEIAGGKGSDIIFGGGGADTFVVDRESDYEYIKDFSAIDDLIDFSGIGGTGLSFADLVVTEEVIGGTNYTMINGVDFINDGFTVALVGFSAANVTEDMFMF